MKNIETTAAHAGLHPEIQAGALSVPMHMAASYKLPGFGIKLFDALMLASNKAAHVYTRWSNPTLRALEERLAAMEGAESALAFASGMAAISAVFFNFLSQGDHVVASEVCYAGAVELLGQHLPRFGIEVSLIDTSDLDQVHQALRPNTRMVYVETPANPILRIADISRLAKIAHEGEALLVIDSTFAGPALQKPLELGADYVVYSLTKYLNGHNDALGGAVLGSQKGIHQIRKEMLVHLGGAMSPFNAWLILRGLETCALRMKKHCENAALVAAFLDKHPAVERVIYPGLESHPHHLLAKAQMNDFGGMIAFTLKGGLGAAISMAERLKVFQFASSLGHPISLMFYYPYDLYVEAADYLGQENKARIRDWVGQGLLRASIGLEDPQDLIADLDQALQGKSIKGLVGPILYKFLKKMV